MGFQINGTEVLGTSGIVNNANSFKTLLGQSIIGTGNIQDDGTDVLLFNKVGTFTLGGIDFTGSTTPITQSSSSVSASSLLSYDRLIGSRLIIYNCLYKAATSTCSTTYSSNLSGTWKSKTSHFGYTSTNTQTVFALFQRIS